MLFRFFFIRQCFFDEQVMVQRRQAGAGITDGIITSIWTDLTPIVAGGNCCDAVGFIVRKKRATAVPAFLDSIAMILQQLEVIKLQLLSQNTVFIADCSQMFNRHRTSHDNHIASTFEAWQ
jgi:hypothetical protein